MFRGVVTFSVFLFPFPKHFACDARTPDGLVSLSWQRAPGTATTSAAQSGTQQRSTGGVHFLESIFKLTDEGNRALR